MSHSKHGRSITFDSPKGRRRVLRVGSGGLTAGENVLSSYPMLGKLCQMYRAAPARIVFRMVAVDHPLPLGAISLYVALREDFVKSSSMVDWRSA